MSTWLEYNFSSPELTKLAKLLEYEKPLHVTLVHFPRNITEDQVLLATGIIDKWVRFFPKRFWIHPKFDKLSQFESGALVQEFSVPRRIYDQRQILTQHFYNADIRYSADFDWNPHVTVGENSQYTRDLYALNRVLIIGLTFHHSFGSPYEWRLKL